MRVLLLMTSRTYKAHAFLAAAKRLDCSVVVGTDRLQVLAHLDPQGNLLLPFNDLQRAVIKIHEHHAQFPLDVILATDDEGAPLAAAASATLGLRGNTLPSIQDATDKQRTRQAFADGGVETPRFCKVRNAQEAAIASDHIGFPCVIKPLHMSASRGVIRANDLEQLRSAGARLAKILAGEPKIPRRQHSWLIEEYIPGREFAVEGLLVQGKLHTLAVFDKPDPLEGPYFQETLYITPSRQPTEQIVAMQQAVARATQALGLQEGPIHAEVRCNGRGVHVLEVAPRSIGGRCSTALRFGAAAQSTLEEVLLRSALRLQAVPARRESLASGVMMIPIANAGILRSVHGLQEAAQIPHITAVDWTIPTGQEVLPPPEGGRYLGFLFARADSPAEVEAALRQAHACLHIEIEALDPVPAGPQSTFPTKESS